MNVKVNVKVELRARALRKDEGGLRQPQRTPCNWPERRGGEIEPAAVLGAQKNWTESSPTDVLPLPAR